jgi:hypothetical protein
MFQKTLVLDEQNILQFIFPTNDKNFNDIIIMGYLEVYYTNLERTNNDTVCMQ